jgi:hypothetical protein
LKGIGELMAQADAEGIPLCRRPKSLRLSQQAYAALLNDRDIFKVASIERETLFGLKYRIDEGLKAGEWKLE